MSVQYEECESFEAIENTRAKVGAQVLRLWLHRDPCTYPICTEQESSAASALHGPSTGCMCALKSRG